MGTGARRRTSGLSTLSTESTAARLYEPGRPDLSTAPTPATLTDNSEPARTTYRDAPMCLECGRSWLDEAERWRLYVTVAEPAELLMYCAACAAREFDD